VPNVRDGSAEGYKNSYKKYWRFCVLLEPFSIYFYRSAETRLTPFILGGFCAG